MPKTTTTTVSVNKANGQVYLTIPRALASAMGWAHGTKVRFEVAGKDRLMLIRTEVEDEA